MATEKQGVIESISDGGSHGIVKPNDGSSFKEFTNPVRFDIKVGQGVTYLEVNNPKNGENIVVITKK